MLKRVISRIVHGSLQRAGYRLYKPALSIIDPTAQAKLLYEHVLALEAFRNRDDFFFVQIGANDGVTSDPISAFVKATNWRGLLIEPVPVYFAKLIENYSEQAARLFFENCAVSEREGYQTLFRVSDDATGLPSWASGLASFDRSVLERHHEAIPRINHLIVEDQVRCCTLPGLLLKHGVSKIDLLQVDAEGYDYNIIRSLDFSSTLPRIIHYECKHISVPNQKELVSKLINASYRVDTDGHDTLAVLNR